MLAVAPSWFASEDWHRSRGYVLATGYLARRRKLVRRAHVLTIVSAWGVTVPAAAMLAAVVFAVFDLVR